MADLWLPVGPDPLTTSRVESFRVDLLSQKESQLGLLRGVTGGTIDQVLGAVISGGGSLDVTDTGQVIDWVSVRVQPWWVVVGMAPWPLGVYLPSAPVANYDETGRSWRVELLDKLAVLDQDSVDGSFSLPSGTVVTTAVKDVITSTGETSVAITASLDTLKSGMVWEAGTTKLRIVNDLLAYINYFSVRCDGYGRYVAAPYVAPEARPMAWAFTAGSKAVHLPDFTRDQDISNIPNKVVLVSTASGDTPALVSVATNTDPASPYSYPRRGRWVVHTETSVEATSQLVLDALAARRLTDQSSVSASLEISHAVLPLSLNDSTTFTTGGLSTRAVVQSTSISLEPGSMMRTKMREVSS
jgi:hypothetical protein